jgi:hypothetical protein
VRWLLRLLRDDKAGWCGVAARCELYLRSTAHLVRYSTCEPGQKRLKKKKKKKKNVSVVGLTGLFALWSLLE